MNFICLALKTGTFGHNQIKEKTFYFQIQGPTNRYLKTNKYAFSYICTLYIINCGHFISFLQGQRVWLKAHLHEILQRLLSIIQTSNCILDSDCSLVRVYSYNFSSRNLSSFQKQYMRQNQGVLRNQFQFEITETRTETSFGTIRNKMFVSVVSLLYQNSEFRCFD